MAEQTMHIGYQYALYVRNFKTFSYIYKFRNLPNYTIKIAFLESKIMSLGFYIHKNKIYGLMSYMYIYCSKLTIIE